MPLTVFSVACNSDYEILAILQVLEVRVVPEDNRLDADKFPVFSGCYGSGKDSAAIWISCLPSYLFVVVVDHY